METKFLKPTTETINLACKLIKNGDIVAIPTETVYGLAGDASNDAAILKIFKAKGRPSDNPLIVHISNFDMLAKLVTEIKDDSKKLMQAFWPGPLTIIMPKTNYVCQTACAGLKSVGVRMPNNKIALDIIENSGLPLAAPSANISGKPSPTTAIDTFEDLNEKIPLVVNGDDCDAGVESTVISMLDDIPIILRPGIISKEEIENVLNKKILLAKEITEEAKNDDKVLSPGMKYKHYSPNAEVYIVKGSLEQFANFLKKQNQKNIFAMCFDDEENLISIPSISYGEKNNATTQAHNLFKVLRKLDKMGAEKIYVRCPSVDGVSLAVYNRLIRSAGFKFINL